MLMQIRSGQVMLGRVSSG